MAVLVRGFVFAIAAGLMFGSGYALGHGNKAIAAPLGVSGVAIALLVVGGMHFEILELRDEIDGVDEPDDEEI